MRNRKTLSLCLFLCTLPVLATASAGWQAVGGVSSVKEISGGVELRVGAGAVRVTALSPNVFRVRYSAQGGIPAAEHSFAVLPAAFPEAPKVRVEQSADSVVLTTSDLRVEIAKKPLRVRRRPSGAV